MIATSEHEGAECMEGCGFFIRRGEEIVAEPGEAPTRHCPGAAPFIAHTECPSACVGCGEPLFPGGDYVDLAGSFHCLGCADAQGFLR